MFTLSAYSSYSLAQYGLHILGHLVSTPCDMAVRPDENEGTLVERFLGDGLVIEGGQRNLQSRRGAIEGRNFDAPAMNEAEAASETIEVGGLRIEPGVRRPGAGP